jgi:small subunit ribosomal protein S11
MAVRRGSKKIKKKNIPVGVAHIHSSYNNTIISFADEQGQIICWSSPGAIGYKGTKKSTPFAAQQAALAACETAKEHGVLKVKLQTKGHGQGKEAAAKTVRQSFEIVGQKDVTPVPHNGCRKPKSRK